MRGAGLAVLEGHWFKGWPMSVAPLVDLVLANYDIRADQYDYERWRSRQHLNEALRRHSGSAKVVYLTAHGRRGGVSTCEGSVTATEIGDLVSAGESGIVGMHFGVCDFLTRENAHHLLDERTSMKWVSGYAASVDWAESAAIDMLFLNAWLGEAGAQPTRIKAVADHLTPMINYLARPTVRFAIYARTSAGVTNLLEPK